MRSFLSRLFGNSRPEAPVRDLDPYEAAAALLVEAALVERHAEETGSRKAATILQDWEAELANFIQVCPTEMLIHLPAPLSEEAGAIPAE